MPSDPPNGAPASAAAPVDPVLLEGCDRFRISIRGRDSVSLVEIVGACGPIRPRLAGRPTFDRVRQVVKLPLAIENGSERKIRPPAFLYGWSDSLRVLTPSGLEQNRHALRYLSFTGADSVTAPTDADLPNAAIWRYDSLLAEPARTLAPGERSRARVIEIDVKQGVSEFVAVVGARARRVTAPVPAQAPDTVPAWVEAPENMVYRPAFHTTVLKNIIIVSFVPGTPQPKRQEAIDLVDGEVVGGEPDPFGIEGDYYVRVDDDGTGRDLLRKEALLRSLPQVQSTVLGWPVGLNYLKPDDGQHWNQWHVLPNSIGQDDNWGLEAIDAPLAWGCETGDPQTQVAVVDHGFFALDDLQPHKPADHLLQTGTMSDTDHGTRVALVLGAVGNNRLGMTGTMWNSDLRLYDAGYDAGGRLTRDTAGNPVRRLQTALWKIRQAAASGAAVINVSSGFPWSLTLRPGTDAGDSAVKAFEAEVVNAFRRIPTKQMPLIVFGAGNDSTDGYWSGWAAAQREFPNNVILVAASTRQSALAHFSNRNVQNNFVEIAAPGEYVGSLDGAGARHYFTGTSAAAPFVAGVAGLMKSHDPRLTPGDLKHMLVAGAFLGGRTAGGIPLLNAWESLKLVGARPGAPLCGNRIWQKDGSVIARRGAGTETLFKLAETAYYINALHGGRRLQLFERGDWDYHDYAFKDGRWTPEAASYAGVSGGTIRSAFQVSHSGDSTVVVNGTMGTFPVMIRDVRAGTYQQIATVHGPFAVGANLCGWEKAYGVPKPGDPDWGDVFGGYSCRDSIPSYVMQSNATAAFSPMGDRVLVVVSSSVESYSITRDFEMCDGSVYVYGPHPAEMCREFSRVAHSAGSVVYSIDLKDPKHTPIPIWSEASRTTPWVGIAEGGEEAVSGVGFSFSSDSWRYTPQVGFYGERVYRLEPFNASWGRRDCAFVFRNQATGSVLESVASSDACSQDVGTATISTQPAQPQPQQRP